MYEVLYFGYRFEICVVFLNLFFVLSTKGCVRSNSRVRFYTNVGAENLDLDMNFIFEKK